MSDDIQSKLSQAYEDVEAGRLEDAINTLKPVLDESPDNADAWWIYLHAVSDPAEARRALDQVMRIAPEYPGALEMQDLLNAEFAAEGTAPIPAPAAEERPQIKPLTPPPPPMSVPETPAQSSRPSTSGSTVPPAADSRGIPPPEPVERRRSPVTTLVVLAVVALAIVLVVLLLIPGLGQQGGATATVEPTAVVAVDVTETALPAQIDVASPSPEAQLPTEEVSTEETLPTQAATEPTAASTSEADAPTEESGTVATSTSAVEATMSVEGGSDATAEAGTADDGLSVFATAVERFELAPSGVAIEDLATGTTVMANVCSAPGRQVRTLLPEVMQALAGVIEEAPDNVEAVGVRLINCVEAADLVTVAAERSDAAQFAAGTSAADEFAATWVALR